VIHLDEDLANYKAVFAPVQYVVSEKQAENIRSYVRGGGTFVAGFRLGVKDESSQIVNAPLPGLLRDVMGVTVRDPVPVYTEKIAVKFGPQLAGADAQCALWADLLQPESATVMATYAGLYEGDAAITMNAFGQGKAVYVGADLEPVSLARVLRTVLAMSGSTAAIETGRRKRVALRAQPYSARAEGPSRGKIQRGRGKWSDQSNADIACLRFGGITARMKRSDSRQGNLRLMLSRLRPTLYTPPIPKLLELPCLTHLPISSARAQTLTRKFWAAGIWASSASSRSTIRPTSPDRSAPRPRNFWV